METENQEIKLQTATIAGGCYWCIEACYQRMKGITNVKPGFAFNNPSSKIKKVEAVTVTYDPKIVSYAQIIKPIFKIKDPTKKMCRDIERLMMIPHNKEQFEICNNILEDLKMEFQGQEIYCDVGYFEDFVEAPEKDIDYYNKNIENTHCQVVIKEKLNKFLKIVNKYE